MMGSSQHGHMAAIGYDLYCRMLEDTVKLIKGEIEQEPIETTVDIKVDAYIPSSYIEDEIQKIEVYKKIAAIENMDDYKDVQNVMPIFKMEALMESEIHQILSAHKKLYGVYQLYNEQNIRECISRKSLGLLSSLGTPFLFFLSEDRKSDTSSAASRFAVDTRMKQAYPFLAVDFYSDITRINEIISGDPLPIHITERMNRLISSV